MTTIEKIKAEIERLYNGEAPKHDQQCDFDDGYFTGIGAISQFIDTLESEKPMNLDFEQELYRRFGMVKDFTLGMRIAQAFYELGCTRTAEKYDEIEYNRQRAEESVPKDLEEASRRYQEAVPVDTTIHYCGADEDVYFANRIVEAFIAGAKWDREQMMKEAVEVYPCFDKRRRLTGFSIDPEADGTNGWSCRIILCKIK